MKLRDVHDVIGGVAMSIIGIAFALYGHANYSMGTTARMGPGYFPIVLGWVLAVLGVLIVLPALSRQGSPIVVQWKNLISCVASLVIFAALLRPAGVAVASVAACLVALVPSKMPLLRRFYISAVVTFLTYLIFVVGLRMSLRTWPWEG